MISISIVPIAPPAPPMGLMAPGLAAGSEPEVPGPAVTAKRLGIAQPRVSDIVRGKVELMSLDYLVGLCAKAKVDVGLRLAA